MDSSEKWDRRALLVGGLAGIGAIAAAAAWDRPGLSAPLPSIGPDTVSAGTPAIVQIDDFAGATDADKLAAAMRYAAAQTHIPALQFPARTFELGTGQFAVYDGMKLVGAGLTVGPKNNERGDQFASGEVTTSAGLDEYATFTVTGDVYGVTIAGVAFQGGSNTQLMHTGAVGNLYSAQLDSISAYGFRHVLGSSMHKFRATQLNLTGHWQVVALWGTGFHLSGSDCWLWRSGLLNLGAHRTADGAAAYLIDLDSLSKSFVGGMYVTADQNFRALRVRGSSDIDFDGCVFEGYKDADATLGNAVRIEDGYVTMRSPRIAYAMREPLATEHGVIEVTGGQVAIDGAKYDPGSTAVTVPLFFQSGGSLTVRSAMGIGGFTPVARSVAGTMSADSSVTLE